MAAAVAAATRLAAMIKYIIHNEIKEEEDDNDGTIGCLYCINTSTNILLQEQTQYCHTVHTIKVCQQQRGNKF